MKVEGLKSKRSEGVNISIAINNPSSKQDPDKMGICDVREF